MRVLAMVHAYPPCHNGGAEMTIAAVLETLVSRGHQCDVILNRPMGTNRPNLPISNALDAPDEAYVRNGVTVHPHTGPGDPFRFITTDAHPDVLISHLENTTRAGVLGSMYDVPVVHLLHNTTDFSRHCLRRGRSDLAVFNTEWMARDYADWFAAMGETLPPSVTAHPAVFTDDYAHRDIDEPNRKVQRGNAITLINLFEPKGGQLFWELARRLPNRTFLGVKGAYGHQIEPEGWREDELYDHVTVWPHCPPHKMRSVYSATRVLLMPSSYESYGRTAVEASASGIPVIAHPTPGLIEALGDDGIFCDRDDPDAWVAALRRLWTQKGYAVSRANALTVAARQKPHDDLARVADAIEGVTRGRLAAAG